MVTDVVKKLRDVFAFALLVVAASYVISALSLLFRSAQSGEPFSFRASLFEYLFTVPVLLLSLVGAVLLAAAFAEPSRYARVVVLAALGIGGVALLFGLICWVTALGTDNVYFGPVLRGSKFARLLLALAKLGLLALVLLFAYSVFARLPKSVPTPQGWGAPPGYGGAPQPYPGAQPYPPYGPPGHGYGPPQGGPSSWPPQSPPQWPQPPDQGWAQPAQPQAAWGPPVDPQLWGPPPAQPEWGASSTHAAQTWGQPGVDQPGWSEYPSAAQPPDHPAATGATAAEHVATEPADSPGEPPAEPEELRG